jgi:broad specificity phosphatase PhoE
MKQKAVLVAMLLLSILSCGKPPSTQPDERHQHGNALFPLQHLSSLYFGFRHGESIPSKEARVCASMQAGVDIKNSLTDVGRVEVHRNATAWIAGQKQLLEKYIQEDRLVIVSSPFSRTRETASIIAEALEKEFSKKVDVVIDDDLREREFGDFEGQLNSHDIYQKVWDRDRMEPTHTHWNVESARSVQARASGVIARLERVSKSSQGKLYILVAHGDTLSLLETAFRKLDASMHRTKEIIKPFQTAEVREFRLERRLN